MREGPPQRAGVVVDRIVMTVLGLAALAGGIALVVYAYTTYQPSEPHHGQALDGLDGIGTFVTMCAGFGGAGLIALGAVMLRAAGRLRP